VPDSAALPHIPADAVLAFVKQASIEATFDAPFVRRALNVTGAEAKQVVAMLEAAGYIERAGERWRTTDAGDVASGAKPPRLRRAGVEKAVAGLTGRIEALNAGGGPYQVKRAVLFGQYLSDHDPIQDADIGVEIEGAAAGREQHSVLAQLRARSSALALRPFAEWMEHIPHRRIWPPDPAQAQPRRRTRLKS